jgi:hypothetical protein
MISCAKRPRLSREPPQLIITYRNHAATGGSVVIILRKSRRSLISISWPASAAATLTMQWPNQVMWGSLPTRGLRARQNKKHKCLSRDIAQRGKVPPATCTDSGHLADISAGPSCAFKLARAFFT